MEGVSRGANLKHQKQTKHKNVEKKVEKKITRTEEIAMFPNCMKGNLKISLGGGINQNQNMKTSRFYLKFN